MKAMAEDIKIVIPAEAGQQKAETATAPARVVMTRSRRRQSVFLIAVLAIQLAFTYSIINVRPSLSIIEEPPSSLAVKVTALGDEQFMFRVMALQLQNSGDSFGRFTSLRQYDYSKLGHWFLRLDELDARSDWIPSLASYYYGMTPRSEDTIHVVDYLEQHADRDPAKKWWWYAQATYIANHKLNDKDLALKLAYKLADAPNPKKPIWAREMPAFIHEQRGELEDSYRLIKAIAAEHDSLSISEQKFIDYFLRERLKAVQESSY